MQEAILSLFPFKFYLTWTDSGRLIKLQFKFNFDINPTIVSISSSKVLNWIKNFYYAFLDYWNFKENRIKVPHQIAVTKFQAAILNELKLLKIGEVITYKKLAEKIGFNKACRAVGKVLSKNPLPLIYPCHRVIGTKGLTGYSQGLLIKQFLLYRELNCKFFDKCQKDDNNL